MTLLKRSKHHAILLVLLSLVAVVTGAIAVIYSHIFIWGTLTARTILAEHREWLFLLVPSAFLIASFLCKTFAPKAAGSGPEHVIEALKLLRKPSKNEDVVREYFSIRVIIVKIISSFICIMGGGALGREGPLIQIAAGLFVVAGTRTKHLIKHFDPRTWIIAGSAAGLAAAFNTPIAGIIFAAEELSLFHLDGTFSSFKTKAFFAVIISGETAQILMGSYTLFGFPALDIHWGISLIISMFITALICALIAWTLKKLLSYFTCLRQRCQLSSLWYLFPILTGLIVALIAYSIGKESIGAGMFTIKDLIASPDKSLNPLEVLGRYLNTIATFSSGSAGGLLLPSLALGAGIGSVISHLLAIFDARILISIGMASFLSAMLNAPLTAAILVLETTGQKELFIPLLLATLMTSWLTEQLNHIGSKALSS